MAKLQSAEEFIKLVKEGKYENEVNAKRGAGRTRLSDSEKKKAFAAIELHFGSGGNTTPSAPKPSKRLAKKAKKGNKKPGARVAKPVEAAPVAEAAPAAPKAAKAPKKKAQARRKTTAEAGTPEGTLPISPSEVSSVADVLQLIDSTVSHSVSIMGALKTADELSKAGDIAPGVSTIKLALEASARLLHQNVVAPLKQVGNQADAEVAARLEQVVNASSPPENTVSAHVPLYVPPPQQAPVSQPS